MIHISVSVGQVVTQPRVVGWRGLHRVEGGREPADDSPGVIPPYNPTVKLKMTKDIQLMSYDLMAYFHPAVRADKGKWRSAHGGAFAMNNGGWNGYDHPSDPRPLIDYVNNRDLNALNPVGNPAYPNYDKMQRTFAGSLITGRKDGDLIVCEPGVDAIDARGFRYIPGTSESRSILDKIIAKHWFSFAVAEGAAGVFKIRPQWGDGIIVFPFIMDRPVSFESRFFAAWDETYWPEPLRAYL
jgi:hypothetical protein